MNRKEREAFQRKFAGRQHVSMDNPYFNKRYDPDETNPKTIGVIKNVRESAIETMYARKKLSKSQKETADRFREHWEACGGTIQSMDYGKEPVDGGGVREPITERLAKAGKELKRARVLLGKRMFDLVVIVCGQGYALREISEDSRDRLTAADNLRASLDELGALWGITSRQKGNMEKAVR